MEGTIGEIKLFAGTFAPRNWLYCQGQLLEIAQNTALFSLLSTQFGGNGTTNFALPDLRGRVPVGAGRGPGLSDYRQGQLGGQEQVVLTAAQMPSHDHPATLDLSTTLNGVSDNASSASPQNAKMATATQNVYKSRGGTNVAMAADSIEASGTATVQANGGSQPHYNMQPYLGLNYIICVQGMFPSRN